VATKHLRPRSCISSGRRSFYFCDVAYPQCDDAFLTANTHIHKATMHSPPQWRIFRGDDAFTTANTHIHEATTYLLLRWRISTGRRRIYYREHAYPRGDDVFTPAMAHFHETTTQLLLRWRISTGRQRISPPNFAYTLAMTQILLPTRIYPNDDANTCHKHFYSRKPHCHQLDENTHFIRLRQKLP